MAKKVSLYLTDDAMTGLDNVIKQFKVLHGFDLTRSSAASILLARYADEYIRETRAVKQLIEKYAVEKSVPGEVGNE